MAKYEHAPDVFKMASELMDRFSELEDCREAKITFLFRISESAGGYLGKCSLASEKWKHLTGSDYVIDIWKPFWDVVEENRRQALVYHELTHIKRSEKEDKDGRVTVAWKLRKHDIELFIDEVRKFGNWRRELEELKLIYDQKG